MRRSEKTLAAILVLGLCAWQGWRQVDRLLVEPIRRGQAELDQLDQQLADQERQAAALQRAEGELANWRQRSLPPDPLTAQRLYQKWLTDLAQDCGFAALKVYPDRVTQKHDACVGVLVAIDAEAHLSQLGLFLSRFYRTDLAQQVISLNIVSTQTQGDPVLRVTIMAEGLALPGAAPRQRLFPQGTLADDLSADQATARIVGVEALPQNARFVLRIAGEYLEGVRLNETEWTVDRGADQSIAAPHGRGELVEFMPLANQPATMPLANAADLVARNPFAKPTPKVVERPPPPKEEEPPEIDPAEFTYLVAAFAQNDQWQAWLYDRLNNENLVIEPGMPFSVGGIEAVVREIGDDFVLLQRGASRWRLRLGKSLTTMERVADEPQPDGEPR